MTISSFFQIKSWIASSSLLMFLLALDIHIKKEFPTDTIQWVTYTSVEELIEA